MRLWRKNKYNIHDFKKLSLVLRNLSLILYLKIKDNIFNISICFFNLKIMRIELRIFTVILRFLHGVIIKT